MLIRTLPATTPALSSLLSPHPFIFQRPVLFVAEPPPIVAESWAVEAVAATITPTPPPTTIPQSNDPARPLGASQANKAEVEAEILRVFGTAVAVAVFQQESGLRSDAFNGTCCYGVTQIHLRAHWSQIPGTTADEKIAWLFNYQNNIAFAKQMYDTQGWGPWEAFTSGAYRKYMP